MGRWGHRLFEGDEDIRHVINIANDMCKGEVEADHFAWILSKALATVPLAIRDFYMMEYVLDVGNDYDIGEAIRQKLDAGLGSQLLDKYRGRENSTEGLLNGEGKYQLVLLAAVMMGAGAKISNGHLKHLKAVLAEIPAREQCAMPFNETCFRGPGKRQIKMALEHYAAGTPRDFAEPSCHACGKVAADNGGKPLTKCGACKNEIAAAYFCDRECRQSLWTVHKQGNCGEPRGRGVAIFHGHGKTSNIIGAYEGAMV